MRLAATSRKCRDFYFNPRTACERCDSFMISFFVARYDFNPRTACERCDSFVHVQTGQPENFNPRTACERCDIINPKSDFLASISIHAPPVSDATIQLGGKVFQMPISIHAPPVSDATFSGKGEGFKSKFQSTHRL